jgi:hypothetical protein
MTEVDRGSQPWIVLGFFAFIKFNPNVSDCTLRSTKDQGNPLTFYNALRHF